MKNIVFISDLHLDESHPEIVSLFLDFLKKQTKTASALYILGDFFEAWIGDDNLTSFNQMIISQLRAATDAGLPIYFMHGNRDFLIGKRFLKASGCIFLPDETVIDIAGTPTLLMHGDLLCTDDTAYLRFRKKAHNRFFQWLFLIKSLKKRRAIAAQYREKSTQHISTIPDHIMDVTQRAVCGVMTKHHVQHLIHGHTHRKAVHTFSLNNQPATRTVLAAWHDKGNALVCDEGGKKELIDVMATTTNS